MIPQPSAASQRPQVRPANADAYLLLSLAALFWGSNFVIGRVLADSVPPMALAFWRWLPAFVLLLPFTAGALWRQRRVALESWPSLVLLSALGVVAFPATLYLGLARTTTVNAALYMSTAPALIMLLTRLLFGERISRWQGCGLGLSLLGTLVLLSRGDPGRLGELHIEIGDAWVIAATVAWALYCALLRLKNPTLRQDSFLLATVGIGVVLLAGLWLAELAAGRSFTPTVTSGLAIGYLAVGPSLLAYVCWNRGLLKVGAATGGLFNHLVPVFGTALALLLLGEAFQPFHAAGACLIAAGIWLATIRRRRPAA